MRPSLPGNAAHIVSVQAENVAPITPTVMLLQGGNYFLNRFLGFLL